MREVLDFRDVDGRKSCALMERPSAVSTGVQCLVEDRKPVAVVYDFAAALYQLHAETDDVRKIYGFKLPVAFESAPPDKYGGTDVYADEIRAG